MSDFDRSRQFGYQVGFDLIKEGKQYLEITTTGDRHTFPFACPAEVGVAHFATDLIARMMPEIERLRERIEELEPAVEDADARVDEAWHEGHKEANAELCGRIERLRTGNTLALTTIQEQSACIKRQAQRIEELEKERDVAEQELWYGYHITHAQIRNAWRKTEELRASLQNLEQPELERIICNVREELMREWGIKRCEGCGGKSKCSTTKGGIDWRKCPACHGEGWVIGGDDDRDRHAEIRSTPLTEKQIENWRRVLFDEIGPMAYELTDEQIERERAKMQQVANELAKEYPDE